MSRLNRIISLPMQIGAANPGSPLGAVVATFAAEALESLRRRRPYDFGDFNLGLQAWRIGSGIATGHIPFSQVGGEILKLCERVSQVRKI